MIDRPNPEELDYALHTLERFVDLEAKSIKNLSQLLIHMPSVGRQLFTMLRAYGEESNPFLPFDAPSKPLTLGPILSLYRENDTKSISLTGREAGVQIKKWDEKRPPVFNLGDPDLLIKMLPSVDIAVPTLTPFVISALVHRDRYQEIKPVEYPDEAEVQQQYIQFLQELIVDLVLLLAEQS